MSFLDRSRKPRLTPRELADQLGKLVNARDWSEDIIQDELACVPIGDPELDAIRHEAIQLSEDYGVAGGETYFGPEQRGRVFELIEHLRELGGIKEDVDTP